MKKTLILITAISLISLWPFLKKGYFESHDGEWMVIRFSAFHQTLKTGQVPVRFVDRLNNNYGYPVLNFLYPMPFYFAELPKILGLNFQDSIKTIFVVSTIASVLFMFWALNQNFHLISAITGAVIYLFAPYRMVDLYVRGSLGESVALVFPPLCFLSILKIAKGKKIFLPVLSISTALLITSHNVIAVLFMPLIILMSLLISKNQKSEMLTMIILGVLAAGFFWIPAIFDLQFVRLSHISVANTLDHLVSFNKLISPVWGYGPSPNSLNGLSTQLGIISLGVILSSTINQLFSKKKDTLVLFLITSFILVTVLMSSASKIFWEFVPIAHLIQFPWRMLSIIVFITPILAAYLINNSKKKTVLALILIIASISSTIPYTKPSSFVDREDTFYSTNESTTTVRDEYMPIWVRDRKQNRADVKIVVTQEAKVLAEKIEPAKYRAKIRSYSDTILEVNAVYFPGWQAKVDGREVKINFDNRYGLINFPLSKGTHEVIIKYSRSPIHLISEVISLLAVFTTVLYSITLWKKRDS